MDFYSTPANRSTLYIYTVTLHLLTTVAYTMPQYRIYIQSTHVSDHTVSNLRSALICNSGTVHVIASASATATHIPIYIPNQRVDYNKVGPATFLPRSPQLVDVLPWGSRIFLIRRIASKHNLPLLWPVCPLSLDRHTMLCFGIWKLGVIWPDDQVHLRSDHRVPHAWVVSYLLP
jgi:hypothetical protein